MKKYIFFITIFSFLIFIFPKSAFAGAGCCSFPGAGCAEVRENNSLDLQVCFNSKGQYLPNADCDKKTGVCKQREGFGTADISKDKGKKIVNPPPTDENKFYFQVPFPGSKEIENASADVRMLEYLVLIFKLGVWFAVFLAIFMIMVAGFLYLTAGGSSERVGRAKEFVGGALSGLVIALFSFVILQTINPRLVELSFPEIPGPNLVSQTGSTCCFDKVSKQMKSKITLVEGETCQSLNSILSGNWVLCSEIQSCLCDINSNNKKYRTCIDTSANEKRKINKLNEINEKNCLDGKFGDLPCVFLDGPCEQHKEIGIYLPYTTYDQPFIQPVF